MFSHRDAIKQHFAKCIERYGNPQDLKWNVDPASILYDPASSLYDLSSTASKKSSSRRIAPRTRSRKDKLFILKKYKQGSLAR